MSEQFEIPEYMLNSGDARAHGADEHRSLFLKGLMANCSVGVTADGVDIGGLLAFLRERTAELDAGTVSRYDFPIWKTIGYLLSFDMEFTYQCVEVTPGEEPDFERDGWLTDDLLRDESDGQIAVTNALKTYLIAAGALASRIGSSSCDAWRKLLIRLEFDAKPGKVVFGEEFRFQDFKTVHDEQSKILWADNEISRHLATAQTTPPPSQKQAKKSPVRGFAVCCRQENRREKDISKRK